jgi:hypothetical protein
MSTVYEEFAAAMHSLGEPFRPLAPAGANGVDLLNLGRGRKITANIAPVRDKRISVKFTGPLAEFDVVWSRYRSVKALFVGRVPPPDRRLDHPESRLQIERPYSDWLADSVATVRWIRETALMLAALAAD